MSEDIFVGNVAVGIVPSAVGFVEKIRAMIVPSADTIGMEFGQNCASKINEGMGPVMQSWGEKQTVSAKESGSTAGEGFAASFRAKIDELISGLPPIAIKANATEANATVDKMRANLDTLKGKSVAIGATGSEAEDTISKIRTDLETLQSKTIGVDITGAEATAELDKIKAQMVALRDTPMDIPIETSVVNWQSSLDKIAELRAEASKPIVQEIMAEANTASAEAAEAKLRAETAKPIIQEVEIVTKTSGAGAGAAGAAAAGEEATLASGIEKEMTEAGEVGGQGFGQKFMTNVSGLIGGGSAKMGELKEGMGEKLGEAGKDSGKDFGNAFSGILGGLSGGPMIVAAGAAAIAVVAVFGEKLDLAQKQLEASLKTTGGSWEQYSGQVSATGKEMAQYGFAQDQVDGSLRKVLQVTGSMSDALGAEKTIANLAAASHISLSAATDQFDKALQGNAKTMKQYGIIVASGTTSGQAMGQAQKLLADQIQSAGSMAEFAAQHHMSLAEATKLVTSAGGPAAKALQTLAGSGLTATSAQSLLTKALSGSAPAMATLKKDHLTLAQLQDLTTQSAEGNISAYNKLGIEVLPKSATAAQKYAQVQEVLNSKLGGQAQAVADSFGGKIAALRAKFEDIFETVGIKVLPGLEKLMDFISGAIDTALAFGSAIGKLVMPAVSLFFTGLGTIFKVLSSGPMKEIVVAIAAVAAGWIALNVIMALNPFVAAGIAIVVLVGLFTKYWTQIKNFLVQWWPELGAVFTGGLSLWVGLIIKYHTDIVNAVVGAWNTVKNAVTTGINAVTGAVTTGMKAVETAFTAAWDAVTSAVKTAWNSIGSANAAGVAAVKAVFTDVINWVKSAWNTIWTWVVSFFTAQIKQAVANATSEFSTLKSAFTDVINWVKGAWNTIWTWVVSFFKNAWNDYQSAVTAGFGWLRTAFTSGINWIKSAWNAIWGWVVSYFKAEWNAYQAAVTAGFGWLRTAFTSGINWVKSAWNAAWAAVVAYFKAQWNLFQTVVTTGFGWLRTAVTSVLNTVKSVWSSGWNSVVTTTTGIWNKLKSGVSSFLGGIQSAFKVAVSAIATIWKGIEDAAKTPVQFVINSVYDPIAKVFDAVTSFLKLGSPLPQIKMAEGGVVPGPKWIKEDIVPALLMPDEIVLSHKQIANMGGHSAVLAAAGSSGGQSSFHDGTLHAGFGWNPISDIGQVARDIGSGVKEVAGDVVSWGKEVGRLVRGALAGAVMPIINGIADVKIPSAGGEWGSAVSKMPKVIAGDIGTWIKGQDAQDAGDGGGSGASVAAYAKQFATGKDHPYVTGGQGPSGWDCSGFSAYVYEHFGYFPGGQKARYGTSETQFSDALVQKQDTPVPGALVFFDDGFYANPGHVGIVLSANSYVGADSPDVGTTTAGLSGNVGFRIPKGGFVNATSADVTASDDNGPAIYKYLKSNLFGGSALAAAGAIASMWGESTTGGISWNPEAEGTGGRGLIGWTPESTLPDSAFTGDPTKDLQAQLPLILKFVQTSGDMGVIADMKQAESLSRAAQLWGTGVERFGISDIKPQGLAMAQSIMNRYARGTIGAMPGWAWVGEQGAEMINLRGGEEILSHEQSMAVALGGNVPGQGYYRGTAGSYGGDMQPGSPASDFKSALKAVEKKLDGLVNATKGVGSDVAGNLNSVGRKAGQQSNYNNRGRH